MPELSSQAGYDVNEVWIATGRRECGAAACLVSHVPGVFSGDCARVPGQFNSRPPCADLDPDEVYCSCRCGVPDGVQAPTCACPHGFTCGLVASHGPFAGSYCLRDGALELSSVLLMTSNSPRTAS
jgi:hypothetical protein